MRSKRRATPWSRRATRPKPIQQMRQARPAVVLTDLKLPDGDGFGVLRAAKELDPELPVVVMTAYGSIQDAVTAMKEGAMDFLAKPVDPDHLSLMVARAIAHRRMLTENMVLQRGAGRAARRAAHHRRRPAAAQVLQQLHRAAGTDATVLLEGESGTGKELFARALHALSPRQDGPFVAINCAAIPETLLETELFGHEKGAFTGASARKPGRFELAHRGTLFLDEIGDLPLTLQAKILRALEEKQFERVGGTQSLHVDVRVVAATNRNLKAARGRAAVPRGPLLPPVGVPGADSAAARAARRHHDPGAPLRRAVLPRRQQAAADAVATRRVEELRAYAWPGNVRELQNCIERAVILSEGDTIQPRHLNLSFRSRAAPTARRGGRRQRAGQRRAGARGIRSTCRARWPRRCGA